MPPIGVELDENGIIRENTMVDDKTVLIGKVTFSKETPDEIGDESIFPKKGSLLLFYQMLRSIY